METMRVDGVNSGTPRRTVVLPQPFAPTIIVSGLSNSIACSLSGLKARMPLIASFSIWDMVAFGFYFYAVRGDGSRRAGPRLCFAFKKRLASFGAATARGGLVSRASLRTSGKRSAP